MSISLKKRVDKLSEMTEVQGSNGNWNFDPYMQGLYNGLEFARSIMEDREPIFRSAPDKWLADNQIKRSFPDPEPELSQDEKCRIALDRLAENNKRLGMEY